MRLDGCKTGLNKEPNDKKFSHFSHLFTNEKENDNYIDLRNWCSPVENQGDVGSCCGNAVVSALELLRIKNKQQHINLSRLFVYYNARLMLQEQEKDCGAYIKLCINTLNTIGTCSEETWPYIPNKVLNRPSWMSYREAYQNKIGDFYEIIEIGEERNQKIIFSLKSGHPVVFGMIVDKQYMNYNKGIVSLPNSNRENSGMHAQLIVGADIKNRLWIIKNSWGQSWGVDGGYAFVPFEYLELSNANDFWVLTAAPNEICRE